MAPDSPDVRLYLALHYARGRTGRRRRRCSSRSGVGARSAAGARGAGDARRQRAGAIALWQRAFALGAVGAGAGASGDLADGATDPAIGAFERARALDPRGFRRDLDLGVLYLAARRFAEAREALDRVPASDPRYPLALFKRAQVSVLLHEPDGRRASPRPARTPTPRRAR